jgi:glutathione S-transferase
LYVFHQPAFVTPTDTYPYNQDDDGFIVYESRAIARYIAEKYADQGTKLLPTEFVSRIRFEQAASIEQNIFHPYAMGVVHEKVGKL